MTPPAPASTSVLRASDAEREQYAELLREQAGEGRLTVEELDERLGAVYAARTHAELSVLVGDLPVRAPRAERRSAPRRRTRSRPEVVAYVAVNLFLIAIWAATGGGYFWPIWPLLGWGLGLMAPCGRALPRRRPQAR
jgi:hypothetical protein